MQDIREMSSVEIKTLLTRHFDYAPDDLYELDDEELYDVAERVYEEFQESELYEMLEASSFIDLEDDELTLLDILDEWEDICDDSDMYPNGRDDD